MVRKRRKNLTRCSLTVSVLPVIAILTGCGEGQPRSFEFFMEDEFARDGTLARCNDEREDTLNDIECANARRAASAIALTEERVRRQQLEIDSERKLEQLRAQMERERQMAGNAKAAAEAAAFAAYEAYWRDEGSGRPDDDEAQNAEFSAERDLSSPVD